MSSVSGRTVGVRRRARGRPISIFSPSIAARVDGTTGAAVAADSTASRLRELRERPFLRVVPPVRRSKAARAPFALLVVVLLGLGLIALLLINTALGRGAYVAYHLERDSQQLTEQQERLQQDVDNREAPGALADRATALGMVPSAEPAFIRLSDGKILGNPQPAVAPPAPVHPPTTGDITGHAGSVDQNAKSKTKSIASGATTTRQGSATKSANGNKAGTSHRTTTGTQPTKTGTQARKTGGRTTTTGMPPTRSANGGAVDGTVE